MKIDYEPEHFGSVLEHMKHGEIFFDVGAYDAQTSLIVAEKVGPTNVVIIEPAEYNWANIKKNWEKVYLSEMPRAMFPGFVNSQDKPDSTVYFTWPPECGNPLREENKLDFRWLHYCSVDASADALPRLTIDTLALLVGMPAGITIDIEGAELLAIRGAGRLLSGYCKPLVWISIHPQFMKERFGHSDQEIHSLMSSYGYKEGKLLKTDQEEHWFFQPK